MCKNLQVLVMFFILISIFKKDEMVLYHVYPGLIRSKATGCKPLCYSLMLFACLNGIWFGVILAIVATQIKAVPLTPSDLSS